MPPRQLQPAAHSLLAGYLLLRISLHEWLLWNILALRERPKWCVWGCVSTVQYPCVFVCCVHKCLLSFCQRMMTSGIQEGLVCHMLVTHAQTTQTTHRKTGAHCCTSSSGEIEKYMQCMCKKTLILVKQCADMVSNSIFQPDRTAFAETVLEKH